MSRRVEAVGDGRERRRASRQIGSWVVLIACAIFFLVPIIALARFSFQKVPVVKLGWSTLFDKWTLERAARRRSATPSSSRRCTTACAW